MSPLVSRLVLDGLIQPRSYNQLETYRAGMIFAQTEGLICAPETNHAIAAAIEEAGKAREEGVAKTIVFCLSGHGFLDLAGYDAYLSGKLTDVSLSEEEMQKSLEAIKSFPKPAI